MKQTIKLGIPRGLLRNQTLKLFRAAGYDLKVKESSYKGSIDDPDIEIFLARDQELVSYTEGGGVDAAIAQEVYIREQQAKVVPLAKLDYGVSAWRNAKLVVAVPKNSKIKTVKDLQNKKILSRIPRLTKQYLKKNKIAAKVEWTDRPAEPKVPLLCDAIVEFTNSGSTINEFNLKIIDTLFETSPTFFISNKIAKDKRKKEKMENLALLLKGARRAQTMIGVTLHVSNKNLQHIFKILPSLKKPTITPLRGENWFELLTVVNKKDFRELLPKLKTLGCADIVEFPLNKVIL